MAPRVPNLKYSEDVLTRTWQAASVLLDLEAQQTNRIGLSVEQVAEVERIQRQVRAGTAAFATDEQMAAFWKKCGL